MQVSVCRHFFHPQHLTTIVFLLYCILTNSLSLTNKPLSLSLSAFSFSFSLAWLIVSTGSLEERTGIVFQLYFLFPLHLPLDRSLCFVLCILLFPLTSPTLSNLSFSLSLAHQLRDLFSHSLFTFFPFFPLLVTLCCLFFLYPRCGCVCMCVSVCVFAFLCFFSYSTLLLSLFSLFSSLSLFSPDFSFPSCFCLLHTHEPHAHCELLLHMLHELHSFFTLVIDVKQRTIQTFARNCTTQCTNCANTVSLPSHVKIEFEFFNSHSLFYSLSYSLFFFVLKITWIHIPGTPALHTQIYTNLNTQNLLLVLFLLLLVTSTHQLQLQLATLVN